jgi:biopolymer transport protein ExbD
MTSRRRHALVIRPATRLNSAINITPLVDIVLVLLIIFMVIAPLLEKSIALQVVGTRTLAPGASRPEPRIVVQVDDQGALRIDAQPIERRHYARELAQRLAPKPATERIVLVVANDRAAYPALVNALDGARRAGATLLGFVAEATPH